MDNSNTNANTNAKIYDNMSEYIESLFNVFIFVNKKATDNKDNRLKMISLVIFNYVKKMAKDYNVDLKSFVTPEAINLIPVFEYISHNNIELYDFSKIDASDLDVTKNEDLERFVLSHVYYLTQK